MPLHLAYESGVREASRVRRVVAGVLARRSGRLIVLALLYLATYMGLRTTKVLVHRHYVCWDENAPGLVSGGGGAYVEAHDIGRGSFFDANGRRANDRFTGLWRIAFWPCVQAESWYWRRHAA